MSGHLPLGSGPEFDRIRIILDELGALASAVGDDTAAVPAGDGVLVVSTDSSVDTVHFRREWISAEDIGWRATAAALSDLAAAAAVPSGVVVALTLPESSAEPELRSLARGIGGAVRDAGCLVFGGDVVNGPALSLTITAFGYASPPVSRGGARAGDGIWVTGVLGAARAAVTEWLAGREPAPAARFAFARPQSRHAAALWLQRQGATAMMDLSDGLAGDVPHLAAASGLRFEVDLDAVPIHPAVHPVAARSGESASRYAAVGGEDYELLVTLPGSFSAGGHAEPACGVTLTRIGTVREGSGAVFLEGGRAVKLEGFRHK